LESRPGKKQDPISFSREKSVERLKHLPSKCCEVLSPNSRIANKNFKFKKKEQKNDL
jgi:hypothetical protein